MSEQATARTDAGLRALLADPTPAAAPHPWHATARTIRFGVAAADAAQLVALGIATQAAFPGMAAAVGAAATSGLGALAAALAIAMRRALREGRQPALDRVAAHAEIARAAIAVVLALGVAAALWWLASPPGAFGPDFTTWMVTWAIASATAAAALRYGAAHLAGTVAQDRGVVLVGAAEQTEALARALELDRRAGWRVIGRIDDREAGGLDRLSAMIEHRGAGEIALAMAGAEAAERVAAVCERIGDQPVRVRLVLDAASLPYVPRERTRVGNFVLLDLLGDPHGELGGAAKRAMDVVLGSLALLCLSPVMAVAALAIRLESPGPVLFRQWRFGLGSRPILVAKFRTMRTDTCDATGERRTVARDPRVTRVGRILRRTSIDELPQLLNVLRGEMSLVGPRPHPLHMRVNGAYYFEVVERYRVRHVVRPGITGWAQVNGSRGEVDTVEKARRRLELDLWYIENWSLALDLRILLRTALGAFASPRAD